MAPAVCGRYFFARGGNLSNAPNDPRLGEPVDCRLKPPMAADGTGLTSSLSASGGEHARNWREAAAGKIDRRSRLW